MGSLFGLPMSVATIEKISQICVNNIQQEVKNIETSLKNAPVKGADESGVRIEGKTRWLHTLCNDQMVHYRASDKRGDVPTDLIGIVIHQYCRHFLTQLNLK